MFASKTVVLDFTAEWCGPCQRIKADLHALATKYGVELVEIDVDAQQDVAQEYRVNAMPTIVFLHEGIELADMRVVGANLTQIEAGMRELAARRPAPSAASQIEIPLANDASVKCQRPTANGAN